MAERTELKSVSCSNCQNLIVDKGSAQSLGECKIMNAYLAEKHDPMQNALMRTRLGGKPFFSGPEKRNDRFCPEFVESSKYPFVHGD